MVIDCHVHVSACTEGHGWMSTRLMNSLPFRFMRWKFGLVGADESTERALETLLCKTIEQTPEINAAVILAFDAVHDAEGRLDRDRTHFYVTNDYVMELARRHPQMLFGASIHPYRRDAVAELERCVAGGAVLVKWLPPTQGIHPRDRRCIPLYEAMAHHRIPLLAHTGGEQSLPTVDPRVCDPSLLDEALRRGVTVIAAHCATRSTPFETCYLKTLQGMLREHENLYVDTSALTLPTRSHAFDAIAQDPLLRSRLVHGSDWPILSMPIPRLHGWEATWQLMEEPNWLRRDVLIKQTLGFDEAYWHRASRVLRLDN